MVVNITLIGSRPKLDDNGRQKFSQRTGTPIVVFKYKVTGTKENLDKFKEVQGGNLPDIDGKPNPKNNYRTDVDGTPVYFSPRPVGVKGQLKLSTAGNLYPDTTTLDLATAMIQNYGEAGKLIAKELLSEAGLMAAPQANSDEHVAAPAAGSKLDDEN